MNYSKGYFLKLSIVLVTVGLIGFSCDTVSSNISASSGTVKAKVDGSNWEGTGGTGVKQTINTGSGSVTTVTVVASKILDTSSGENETMEVTIYSEVGADNISETSYDVAEDEIPGAQFSFTTYVDGVRTSYFATSGTVTVKSVSDDNVKGEFEGTVVNVEDESDTKEVKNGAFNVNFGFSF